ncbi:MAG TPA: hypothetical protein VH877_05675 [Polyangia bacterium]|jgi:hypothetical protein|nr:hypothetical protein [Polyangia bacterium]
MRLGRGGQVLAAVVLLVGAGAGAACGKPRSAGNPGAAEPFRIEFRSISQFPTCRGNRRVKVEPDGKVYTAFNKADCPRGSDWSTPYPSEPAQVLSQRELDRLIELVQTSGFWNLPAVVSDPRQTRTDGHRERSRCTSGRRCIK